MVDNQRTRQPLRTQNLLCFSVKDFEMPVSRDGKIHDTSLFGLAEISNSFYILVSPCDSYVPA